MKEEFRLIYFHRETGEKYLAERLAQHYYVIIDPVTEIRTRISKWFLKKHYRADKGNPLPKKNQKLDFRKR